MVMSRGILRQTLACSPVLSLQFLIGTFSGWMFPVMAKLNAADSEFHFTADQASWFASINEVGRVLGPFFTPPLVDKLGRKSTLIIISIMYLVVWSCTIFVRDFYIMCALRILFGFGNATNDIVSGIYTTENCSPNFRGTMGSMALLTFFSAMLIECIMATYLSILATAIINTAMAACALVNTLYYSVETPSLLLMKGNREKAEKNLIWLSGTVASSDETDEELRRLERSIAEEKSKQRSVTELLSSSANMKRIVLVVAMNVLGMAAGASAFGIYASVIFQPTETVSTSQFIILYGAVPLLALITSPFFIERVDRRALVLGSNVGMTVSNLCSFLLTYLYGRGYAIVGYPWLIFVSVASYNFFGAVNAPVGYALRAELLPFSVRAIGNSMAVVGFSFSSFAVAKTFLPVTERFGMETNFLVYFVMSLLTTAMYYYFLPETRGKTLYELQNVQKKKDAINDNKV